MREPIDRHFLCPLLLGWRCRSIEGRVETARPHCARSVISRGGSDWPGRSPQSEPSWTTLTQATGLFGFIVRFGQIIASDDLAASSCTTGEVHVCLLAACFRPSVGGRRRIVETRRWAYYSSRAGSRASEPAECPGSALAGPEQGKCVAPAHLAERRRGHAGRRACLPRLHRG